MAQNPQDGYDAFLSHSSEDKPWVRALHGELERLGLRSYLDERELKAGDNWTLHLSEGVFRSRFLVLVLSPRSVKSKWVEHEWTSFMAEHGHGRLIPVLLDDAHAPTFIKPIQRVDARDRDAARVARQLADRIGKPGEMSAEDPRRLYIGQDLVFVVGREGDDLAVTDPTGRRRVVAPPWRDDNRFTVARLGFARLTKEHILNDSDRAELHTHAVSLGDFLYAVLCDETADALIRDATIPGLARPLLTIRSADDVLLSLPWELIRREGTYLVRDGSLDLARGTGGDVGPDAMLNAPSKPFELVLNVSAPEKSGLDYEGESYRLTLALTKQCKMTPTELGTLDDLGETVRRESPTGIHFSGHGAPGHLQFENDEGGEDLVSVERLVKSLKGALPGGLLPHFFYLANCHGNDPGVLKEGGATIESLAARLHREGVCQVVGYYNPIADELSTRAEVALYSALAEGHPTRFAVRCAREALARPFAGRSGLRQGAGATVAGDLHPFAWAQLVFYHRGPDVPLGLPVPAGSLHRAEAVLRRTFSLNAGDRRILTAGFIGRRKEMHRIRRRVSEGRRVHVFQGLGGLGKSTLALEILKLLGPPERRLTFWCQDAEKFTEGSEPIAGALVDQLLVFCRKSFGLDWEGVVQQVDRAVGDDPAERFRAYFGVLVQNFPGLVVYLDNLESLLIGPKDIARASSSPLPWERVAAPRPGEGTEARPSPGAPGDRPAEEPSPGLRPPSPRGEGETAAPSVHASAASQQQPGTGPSAEDFASWRSPALAAIWQTLATFANDTDSLHVVASTRYPNRDFKADLLPVSPLPADALFRLMAWFPGLRRLTAESRDRLTKRLDGHPRAVEFANTLIESALTDWEDRHRPWPDSDNPTHVGPDAEWSQLVEPALPTVRERLRENLLFDAIWDNLLDDRARRMLFRMTLLRDPWDAGLNDVLGEPSEPPAMARITANRLRLTSLLEQVEVMAPISKDQFGLVRRFTLHPATIEFVHGRFGEGGPLRLDAHRRIGTYLEIEAKTSPDLSIDITAGHHLFLAGEYDRSSELLGPASESLQDSGRVREALRLLEPFLALPVRSVTTQQHVGQLFGTIADAYSRLGQVERAIDYQEQGLIIFRTIGDRRGEGNILGSLGNMYAALGQVERAISYHEQDLMIRHAIGDRRGEGTVLSNLGAAYYRLGQVKRAIGYYEQGLLIDHEIGDRRGEGTDLGNLGLAYAALGQVERAIPCYEQSIMIFREIGDRRGEAYGLGNLGIAYHDLGQVERAIGYYEQQMTIVREIGDRRGEGSALGSLGNAYHNLGQVERAIGYYEQRLVIARDIGDRRGEDIALGNLGVAYAALGQVEQAIGYHEQALVIARDIGDRRGEGAELGNLGNAYARLAQMERAIGYYEQQLGIAREIGDRRSEGTALGNLGIAYANQVQAERAIALLEQAVEIGQEIKDPQIVRSATNTLKRLLGDDSSAAGSS